MVSPRPSGGCPVSTSASPISVEASCVRSPASSSRPTTGCAWKTSPSPTSSATGTWPAPSETPAGRSWLGRSPTSRPGGVGRCWSPTAGCPRPGPAHVAGSSSSGWDWPSGPSTATPAGWRWIATPPPTSPPGPRPPAWRQPGSRTAKRVAGSIMPLEGKALAILITMVQPAPMKGEPTPTPCWREPRTPEEGGVRQAHRCWTRFHRYRRMWTFSSSPTARKLDTSDEPP
jgi:hypothetical protein